MCVLSVVGLLSLVLVFHMFYRRATNPVLAARIRAVFVALVMLSVNLAMVGCAGSKTHSRSETTNPVSAHSGTGNRRSHSSATLAASIAEQQIGIPYQYGGADRKGFDCSGLVYFAYSNAGKQVARTTAGLWGTLQPVPTGKLETGDVLFFDIDGKMSHVGLYLGQGRFVHAPSSGRHVAVAELDSGFYRRALIRGGRAN